MSKKILITLSSAIALAGVIRRAGEEIEVDEPLAKNLLNRGKAVLADETADDDTPLEDYTVSELKEVAVEYEIEGVANMKKADLIAAIREVEEQGGH